MANELDSMDFSKIANPSLRAQGAKGVFVRLGTHITEILALRFFLAAGTQPGVPGPQCCVVELKALETKAVGSFNNMRTKAEVDANEPANGSDRPHEPGERLSCSWKNEGKVAQIFDSAVKGAIIHAKSSVVNMIAAMRKLEGEGKMDAGTADETAAYYISMGILVTGADASELTGPEIKAAFGNEQPFAGTPIETVSVRGLSKANLPINKTAFAPLTVEAWTLRLQA